MSTFTRATAPLRAHLSLGTSAGTLAAALLLAAPAHAQTQTSPGQPTAGTKVTDPADSSSSAANPNESASAPERKAGNQAVAGDTTPAASAVAAGVVAPTQDSPADNAEAPDIVVTGFRRSLETAVAEKKSRDEIVESVSAEDIGKLPDASIAESIARLPGLTAQRVSGRDTTISIRGLQTQPIYGSPTQIIRSILDLLKN